MAYQGNRPAEAYSSFQKQDFTTSATTSYTLDHKVANENELALFINFVRQEAGTAYTASNNTLTLSSATSASDDMYCIYLGKAIQTVNPPSGSVGSSQVSADLITGQTALASEPATTDELLISDAGTLKRIDYSLISNRPAFEAVLSAHQSINDNATDKVEADTEILDTDSCYDNSTNFRFQPNVAGKYFVYARVLIDDSAGALRQSICLLFKNGSELARANLNFDESSSSEGEGGSVTLNTIVDMNGSSDYLELFAELDSNDSGSANVQGVNRKTGFGAFKLIGV